MLWLVPSADWSSLACLLDEYRHYGAQTAVVSREGLRRHVWTHTDIVQLAGRFATELARRRIAKGDRVILWGPNNGAWIAAFWGCVLQGVVAVPIDIAGSDEFARRVARETAAKLAVGDREHLAILNGTPTIPFDTFANLPTTESGPVPLTAEDTLQIIFTSGTTGEPKGVVHTHRNILASLLPIRREMQKYLRYERIFHPLRFLHTLPLSHVFGEFMGFFIPPLLGAEVYFETRLTSSNVLSTIHQERISVLVAVPRVIEILREDFLHRFPDLQVRMDASRGKPAWARWWTFRDVHRALGLKFWALVCGGATLPEHLESFWSALGFAVIQGYGMTETAALVSLAHPFKLSHGSIGKVLPGREIRLSDEGEILVRGDTVAKSSWQEGRQVRSESEWLATGDLGALDAEGHLRFRGRKKDVIVTAAGLNIYPEDLEAALLHQSQVKAAAVVEVAGLKGSEPVAALIVPSGDPAEAVRAANRELAEYQQIRRWILWPDPDFPRTSTGKVLRRVIAAAIRRENTGAAAGGSLEALLQRITGVDPSSAPDTALLSEDLRLDSLGRVELQSALELEFGLPLSDAEFQGIRKLGDIRAALRHPVPVALAGCAVETSPHIYPVWPWSWFQQALRGVFLELVMRPLVAILGKPGVRSNLAEAPATPVLIVANHVTVYDVPLILYALPSPMRRRVAVAMAGELLLDLRKARNQGSLFLNWTGPLQYFLGTALFNLFPLPQQGNFRESFAHAARAMDRGYHVIVFPEGRRTPDLTMRAFQSGTGLLWSELRSPVLPVALRGLAQLRERGHWFRSGRIEVHIGAPLAFDPTLDPGEAAKRLEQAVRDLL